MVPASFVARLKALSHGRRNGAIARLRMFQAGRHDAFLKLRRLRCAPGHWIINMRRGDRIVLRELDAETYAAADVGGHEIYDEWERRAR